MENSLIEVTSGATELMRDHFKDKKKKPIRIFVKLGGCGIRSFGIALEKALASDQVFEIEGYQYIIDKKLLERVAPVKIDSDGYGFRISGSGVSPQHGCGNCGFLCGDGSRCAGDCETCGYQCAHGRRVLKAKINAEQDPPVLI